MDKAGIAFLVLICILVALVLSLLALSPTEEPLRIPPAMVPEPKLRSTADSVAAYAANFHGVATGTYLAPPP
jgi:hypothetical protein